MYATNEEKAAIINSCGEPAVILYEFYLSKLGDNKYRYTDAKSAKVFGWTSTKARTVRLRLEKAGWFDHIKTSNNGFKAELFFIGPIEVLAYRLETRKQKASAADVASELKALDVKYEMKKMRMLLKRWIEAGFVAMTKHEKNDFKKDPWVFVETCLPPTGKW